MQRTKVFRPPKAVGSKVYNPNAKSDALYKTPEWIKFRLRFLAVNPHCYCCGEVATVVDHIQIHRGNEALFRKVDNMMQMCARCHNTITALFDRHAKQKYEEKLRWIAATRARKDITIRVRVIPFTE